MSVEKDTLAERVVALEKGTPQRPVAAKARGRARRRRRPRRRSAREPRPWPPARRRPSARRSGSRSQPASARSSAASSRAFGAGVPTLMRRCSGSPTAAPSRTSPPRARRAAPTGPVGRPRRTSRDPRGRRREPRAAAVSRRRLRPSACLPPSCRSVPGSGSLVPLAPRPRTPVERGSCRPAGARPPRGDRRRPRAREVGGGGRS